LITLKVVIFVPITFWSQTGTLRTVEKSMFIVGFVAPNGLQIGTAA